MKWCPIIKQKCSGPQCEFAEKIMSDEEYADWVKNRRDGDPMPEQYRCLVKEFLIAVIDGKSKDTKKKKEIGKKPKSTTRKFKKKKM